MTRAVLITFQFSVSLLLAYSAQVMVKQLNFVSDRVVDQNQTLVIDLPLEEDVYPLLKKFDASLKQLSFVNQSAFIGPGAIPASKPEMDIFKVDVNGGSAIQTLKYVEVDPNYFHVLGFQLLAGRLFTDDEPGDWSAVIVDERYVKQQGWKDDPLQHKICYGGNACEGLHILGVVRHEGIGGLPQKENPLLYYPLNKQPEKLIVKLSAINHEKLEQIKTRWGDIVQRPIQYQFLDHYIGLQLERERKVEQQVYLFSATAVLLIAAGLFGMIHGHLSRKKRETAIRKVFGAPIKDLLQLSWTRHVLLFVVSLSLAYPLSYIILQDWLGNFPSKVDVGFMAFIQIAFLHLAILLMAISYHAWQLTRAKPINVIRHE
jgi:putative ABC transport system permease protein